MKKEQGKRRSFLKHILAGSAAVAGVAVTRKKAQAADLQKVAGSEVLYQETEDFKKYYKSLV
ncbi:hypothetical protein [Desulfotalea psychrophila]|nr:hypothetical protein [Desulfotalea psychrophila]